MMFYDVMCRYLHSHKHMSPLSSRQEVSCFSPSDTGIYDVFYSYDIL